VVIRGKRSNVPPPRKGNTSTIAVDIDHEWAIDVEIRDRTRSARRVDAHGIVEGTDSNSSLTSTPWIQFESGTRDVAIAGWGQRA
jgi:hypothetical protein